MEAKYIKSYSLLVSIMSYDEHNYLTAPPIHQEKDEGESTDFSAWCYWFAAFFQQNMWNLAMSK